MLLDKKITAHSRLGFIGLGYLGSRIARRLALAGFPMTVYDRDPAKTKEFEGRGVDVAIDTEHLAGEVDAVLSCLPHGAAVDAVYMGTGNVLRRVRPGTLIVELSTIGPEDSFRLHTAARQFGISALDVTVSGSTRAAEAGTLTLFGGGDRRVFEGAGPIFAAIASQRFYMGPSGSGVAMKMVVNTLLGLGMQAVAEAVALGSSLGLQRDLLFDTLAKTTVVAPAHAGKLATAKQGDYTPQFPVRLMQKDFGLILAVAAQAGLAMPATEAAAAINAEEAAAGGEIDYSAVVRRMEEQAKWECVGSPA
jgi:3-hydroxyisobutyrate dehydrogenase-like beta-hydroxyacid dehydrogenase